MRTKLIPIIALMLLVLLSACSNENVPEVTAAPAPAEPAHTVTEPAAPDKQPSSLGNALSGDIAAGSDSWQTNVMSKSGLNGFAVERAKILTVTFLDSLESAPDVTWNLGDGSTETVLGWIEYQDQYYHLYIAANGGINGRLCTETLFQDCINLYQISFNGAFHTEEATSMENMFCDCKNLLFIDADTLSTSNVKNMHQMFYGCTALEDLDLSSFDTGKVTDMSKMFFGCKSLRSVDTSSFNTSAVRNMSNMFCGCNVLTEVYLNDWDFSGVTDYKNFMNEDVTVNGQPWEALFG